MFLRSGKWVIFLAAVLTSVASPSAGQHQNSETSSIEAQTINLQAHAGGTPTSTISPPADWKASWIVHNSVKQLLLTGDGVGITVIGDATAPNYPCSKASCGFSSLVVDGLSAKLFEPPSFNAFLAFVPSRQNGSTGIRFSATCRSPESCRLAKKVLGSLRVK